MPIFAVIQNDSKDLPANVRQPPVLKADHRREVKTAFRRSFSAVLRPFPSHPQGCFVPYCPAVHGLFLTVKTMTFKTDPGADAGAMWEIKERGFLAPLFPQITVNI